MCRHTLFSNVRDPPPTASPHDHGGTRSQRPKRRPEKSGTGVPPARGCAPVIWHAKSLGYVSNGCAGPFKRSREDPPQGTTGGERRGRVWKTRQHRRAASAPLESYHEPGRSVQPLTGKFGAFESAQRPSTHVRGRSARCRRSFSDAKSYRSQISFLFFGKGAESTGSLSDGPNPLLEDSFFPDGRFAL